MLAPEIVEREQANAYSQILFIGAGRAQVMAYDRAYPGWGWSAVLTITSEPKQAFSGRCESVIVFSSVGKNRIVYRRVRGGQPQFLSNTEGDRETAERFLKESDRVRNVVPKSWLDCAGDELHLSPVVQPGGRVVLEAEGSSLKYVNQGDEGFRGVVDRLPEPSGQLEPWRTTSRAFRGQVAGLYHSLSNRYLPLPQAHRFYRLNEWKSASSRQGEVRMEGKLAARPEPKELPNAGMDSFSYNQIERGAWIELTPVRARLFQKETASERQVGVGELSADGKSLTLRDAAAVTRVEIEYEIPGKNVSVYQSIGLSTGGELTGETALVRGTQK